MESQTYDPTLSSQFPCEFLAEDYQDRHAAPQHYIPLESNPELFTELIHRLGVSPALAFRDVLSLSEPELLALIPRPCLGLVLTFPAASPGYETGLEEEERDKPPYEKRGEGEDVVWYKQTIHNACGLYGILHAVSNGRARDHIVPGSHLSRPLTRCEPLGQDDRARVLEEDEQLEAAHKAAGVQGVTEAPASAEEEVDYHYVCFVKSHKDDVLYQLDGDRKGPIARVELGPEETPDQDLLSEKALAVVTEFIQKAADGVGFSLLALAPES